VVESLSAILFVAFAAAMVLVHIKGGRWLSWPVAKLKYWRWTPGSESWPQVEGFVERAEWNYKGKNEHQSWPVAEVAYSYDIEGERYANILERPFTNAANAADFVLRMRDHKVLVRYRPGKPEKSVVSQVIGL
jgi:hypothetical protein